MLNKISGLARAIYIVLAIIAGFVAMDGLNLALILVVLGLIAGLSMPRDRMVLALVAVGNLPSPVRDNMRLTLFRFISQGK